MKWKWKLIYEHIHVLNFLRFRFWSLEVATVLLYFENPIRQHLLFRRKNSEGRDLP